MIRIKPIFFLIAFFLAACSQSGSTTTGRLITSRGTFMSPSGTYQLVISSRSKSFVDYKIINVATKEEVAPKNLFSDVMRWAAYWEDDNTIWVYSSDIGTSVWRQNSKEGFSQEWLGERPELVSRIPAELWSFMPSSLRRRWEPLHQKISEHGASADSQGRGNFGRTK
jgi:hypothetical protein